MTTHTKKKAEVEVKNESKLFKIRLVITTTQKNLEWHTLFSSVIKTSVPS